MILTKVIMIELLRRTLEEQFADDLAYDKDMRAFCFRVPEPLSPREYRYRSRKEKTSATVVQLHFFCLRLGVQSKTYRTLG
jgi:hypothetical protein